MTEQERRKLFTKFIISIVKRYSDEFIKLEPECELIFKLLNSSCNSYLLAFPFTIKEQNKLREFSSEIFKIANKEVAYMVIIIELVVRLLNAKESGKLVIPQFTKDIVELYDAFEENLNKQIEDAGGLDDSEFEVYKESKEVAKKIWEKSKYYLDLKGL